MDTQLSVEHLSRRIRELEEQVDAKRWENELMRTDLERTKALVDHFPMATLILAGNGVLTGVNRRWESLWGGQSQEVVGAFNVLNDPQFRESGIAEGICRALGGEYVSLAGFELDPKRSGFPGQPHWACCHIFPLEEENGSSRQVVVIFEDVTLCKQLEDNYSIVVDNTNEAIMVIQDGLIKFFNQKALSIAGYTNKEQYINQSFLQFLHPDYHDLVTGRHEQRVQGESVPNFYQIQVLHKDGRPIWLQLNAIKIDWEGRPASLAFMSDISDLKQTEEELRHNCEVQTIINSILTISQADISLEEFLQKSLEIVIGVPWLVFEARASISIVEEESDVLVMKAKNGLDPFYLKECRRVPFGRCLCGKAALSQVTEFADRMDDRHEVRGPRTFEHGHYCVPILFGGKTLGVFNVSVEKGHQRNAHYEAALAAIVNTLAGIIVHKKSVQESMDKLQKTMEGMIQSISLTTEIRDAYTAGHQRRTARLACAIAEEMSLSLDQIQGTRIAGEIHDLGKISVPAEILSKSGRISDAEFALIKNHPQTGFDILKGIDFPWPIAQIVQQHHERLDGSGYPLGLAGDQILLGARVLAVADVVEAMASHRPYRPALGIDQAIDEVTRQRGKAFDPSVVDAFVRLHNEKGYMVE